MHASIFAIKINKTHQYWCHDCFYPIERNEGKNQVKRSGGGGGGGWVGLKHLQGLQLFEANECVWSHIF